MVAATYVLSSTRWQPHDWLSWVVIAFFVAVSVLWFRIHRVGAWATVNTDCFVDHDGTQGSEDYEDRYAKIRNHLLEAIKDARSAGTTLGKLRQAQFWFTVMTTTAVLAFFLRAQLRG